jgi:hypothetical protein
MQVDSDDIEKQINNGKNKNVIIVGIFYRLLIEFQGLIG